MTTKLDAVQCVEGAYNEAAQSFDVTLVGETGGPLPVSISSPNPLPVLVENALVTVPYDAIALTYVPSGNGVGQIQTAVYYTGGLSGTVVATLTLTYDGSNNLVGVVET